ncbi:MAG: nucleotidyltransferase domain-containing protein [bacterium]
MLTSEQIDQICAEYPSRGHIDGILLCGSYVYGEPTEESDLDIRVVSNDGSSLDGRDTWRFGTRIELFINPPERLREYFEECMATAKPHAVHFWAHGRIVFDRNGVAAALQKEAREIWERGPRTGTWQHLEKWQNRKVAYRDQ